MPYLELGPRPGRDYTTVKEAKEHWKENRDFIVYESGLMPADLPIHYGMTTSREDIEQIEKDRSIKISVIIRYARQMKVGTLK